MSTDQTNPQRQAITLIEYERGLNAPERYKISPEYLGDSLKVIAQHLQGASLAPGDRLTISVEQLSQYQIDQLEEFDSL